VKCLSKGFIFSPWSDLWYTFDIRRATKIFYTSGGLI